MTPRVNWKIRAPKVRVIDEKGKQVGVLSIKEALELAEAAQVDLVEIAPNANPPVCKVIDYGKYRYNQTKREKESKKAQHQIKVKEIKLKPNIDEHDFLTKLKRAKQFVSKGNKVKISCFFRGREMAYPELGKKIVQRICDELEEEAQIESPMKMLGRVLTCVLSPKSQKGKSS